MTRLSHADRRNGIASALYNFLVLTCRLKDRRLYRRAWRYLWDLGQRKLGGPVATKIHGRHVTVNFGFTYPINARLYPRLNDPLLHLVQQCYACTGRPIWMVDVGAAIGDTVLLVDANSRDTVRRFICVEGDEGFFSLLCANLNGMPGVQLVNALLSAAPGEESSLVRIHGGTASAQGRARTLATTLDTVLSGLAPQFVDLLKIDVDGFDGRVLLGSKGALRRFSPPVIFEWHPRLCHATGSSPLAAFDALRECGYDKLVWFNKLGFFSHFSVLSDDTATSMLERYCITEESDGDWHYDVVALPTGSPIDPVVLAQALPAGLKRSRH